MKKRFSVEQITAVLQQAAQGVPVGDLIDSSDALRRPCGKGDQQGTERRAFLFGYGS